MAEQQTPNTFKQFLNDHFVKDGVVLGLGMKENNGKFLGGHSDFTLEEIKKVHNCEKVITKKGKVYKKIHKNQMTHLELRLRYTENIVCIDIDGIKENEDCTLDDIKNVPYLQDYMDCCAYTLSRNKRLPHFYVKLVGVDTSLLSNTYTDCFKNFKGDLLINHAWEKIDAPVYNYDSSQLVQLDFQDLKPLLNADAVEKITKHLKGRQEKQPAPTPTGDMDLLTKIVELIHIKYCDGKEEGNDEVKRTDWVAIVCAMKKCGFSQEFAREWSAKSASYTESGFDSTWNSYEGDQLTCGEGTLRYYAKKSNPEEYAKLTKKPLPDYDNESALANLFWELKGDSCLYVKGNKYIYFKNAWRQIQDVDLLRHYISTTLRAYFEMQLKVFKDDHKTYEKILTYLQIVCKTHWIVNITKQFTDRLVGEQIDQEDVFDKKPNIFAFKNVAFDLQTRTTCQIKKEDYITQNTNNKYTEPTREELNVIDKLFTQIFPDPEVRKCYLSVLMISLTGEHPENLFLANGCGRNGKGLLNELMFELMGDYAYKVSIDVLTKDVKKTGANPEIANLHKKRLVLANEPEDNVKLNMGIIKELTGGNEISARALYSNDTKTLLHMLLLVECNKKPLIAGRIDTSVLERIVDIPFEACFVSNQEDVDEAKHIYLKNIEFKTEAWRQNHYSALFRYLLDHAPAKLYIPPRILQLSKQYVLGSDELYAWINENYEPTDNTEYIKVKDIFDLYKASDLYSNLTKLEKRNLNKKSFSDLISNHIVLKKQFRNNKTTIAGKSVFCERIHGLKLKQLDEDEDDEEVGHQP